MRPELDTPSDAERAKEAICAAFVAGTLPGAAPDLAVAGPVPSRDDEARAAVRVLLAALAAAGSGGEAGAMQPIVAAGVDVQADGFAVWLSRQTFAVKAAAPDPQASEPPLTRSAARELFEGLLRESRQQDLRRQRSEGPR